MQQWVEQWAAINSGTLNPAGVNLVAERVAEAVQGLSADIQFVDLPAFTAINDAGEATEARIGRAVVIRRRPSAPVQVMLAIHLDTVYGPDDPFQEVRQSDENTLVGPGVADAKGGVAVMLTALAALERSDDRERIGWRVVLNPDEEIASPTSADLLRQEAKGAHVAMLYEPALPDGSLIGQRKGSGNFSLVVRGRAAHAGRDFANGRNAIHALAAAVTQLSALTGGAITVNVGRVIGGGPVNRVPDLAIARFNTRVESAEQQQEVLRQVHGIVEGINQQDGISAVLHGAFASPPKPLNAGTRDMLEQIAECGRELGLSLAWQSSGGVCDGNRIAAFGVPTVDTLGPRGGNLHSPEEYLRLDSLTERAKLSALLLLRYASGDLAPPQVNLE